MGWLFFNYKTLNIILVEVCWQVRYIKSLLALYLTYIIFASNPIWILVVGCYAHFLKCVKNFMIMLS